MIVATALIVSLMLVAWSPTLVGMGERWFAAGGSYYAHGPLVPIVSALLAIGVFRRCGFPNTRSRRAAWIGWMAFVACCMLHLLSVYARVMFVSGFAAVGAIAGLLLILGGRPALRAYAAPVVLLVFAVPLPMHWIAELSFILKTFAAHAALWLTNNLCQVDAILDGSYVRLADGALVIDNVCSGLRSLIALLWFASLYAVLSRGRGPRRTALIVAAAPVAIVCNIGRITVLNIGADRFGIACAAEGGWLHEITGPALFAAAIATQYGLDRLLGRSDCRMPFRGARGVRSERSDEGKHAFTHPRRFVPAAGFLFVVAALSLIWSRPAVAAPATALTRLAAPRALHLGGVSFTGTDHKLDAGTLAILGTDDYLYRTYAAGRVDPIVRVLIVYSGPDRTGIHPPEVCLAGSGHRIVAKAVRRVGADLPAMQELVTDHNGRRAVHLYIYKCGRRYTRSFAGQQAMIVANGLLRRNAGAAVIRLTASAVGGDETAARQLAMAAAGQILPETTAALP